MNKISSLAFFITGLVILHQMLDRGLLAIFIEGITLVRHSQDNATAWPEMSIPVFQSRNRITKMLDQFIGDDEIQCSERSISKSSKSCLKKAS